MGGGNLNFGGSSQAGTALSLNDGVTVTGNITNTIGNNVGTLIFVGNGKMVTGTIGAVGNSLSVIYLNGGLGKTINLMGNTTVANSIYFTGYAAPNSTLSVTDGVTITANIDNNTGSPSIGTIEFLGNATVTGSIGATGSLYEINQMGAGKTVNYGGNIDVGAGNLNFTNNASATTTANFLTGDIVITNLDNTTGTAGNGTVIFQGSGQITGSIGASNALNLLTVNAIGSANSTLELNGTTINVNTINVNDDLSKNPANGSTLEIDNTTGALILNGSITATTTGEDNVTMIGTQLATINGSIGTASSVFNQVSVGLNSNVTMNGNIYANTVQIQGNNTLTFGNNTLVSGNITTTSPNQGSLTLLGNFTAKGMIGTNVDPLHTILMLGPENSVVTIDEEIIISSGNVNFGEGTTASTQLTLANNVIIDGNVDNLSGDANIGTLNFLGNGSVTGLIGITDTIYQINLSGGAGDTVTFDDTVNVGTGNINYVTGAATTTSYAVGNNVTINGSIDNLSNTPNIGTFV